MFTNSSAERQLIQALAWGTIHYERLSPANTQFAVTGRRIYVTGDIDGRFRPRSNPYDLYQFGKPQPGDPLGNRLQGVWAQPVKGITRYGYRIEGSGEPWILEDAVRFNQTYAAVQFDFERGPLQAVRYDYAALDLPLLFSSLTVRNTGMAAVDLRIAFQCEFDLQDAWFTHRGPERNTGQRVAVEAGRLVARSQVLPDEWAAAAGGVQAGELIHLLDDSTGEWVGRRQLAPGAETTLVFGMVVTGNGGAAQALAILEQGLAGPAASLNENQARFNQVFNHGPRLTAPDAGLCQAFQIAQANLHLLEAEQPELDRYFYAGLEMFPFWFSCDGAYSAAGLFAAGLRDTALNHIRLGYRHMQAQGRVPHQISPSGQVAFAGNAQETQQWVMSIWDAYRWTGDREFLAEMYPGVLRGLFDYVLGTIDPDGDGYPSGPGMVEVEGMGPEKLDSAAYTWAALRALSQMAAVLGDSATAQRARTLADQIAGRFDADWWDAQGGTYAMSLLDANNTRYPVPHWAVIVPLEVGLAEPNHAAQTLDTLRAAYLNRWGLKHTVGNDERVWTLPTATLSRSAYRYNAPELGFQMLQHVAETLQQGSIGMFHELIPEGACFLQLWSGATFLRGVIEDLFGIQVNASEHRVQITPQLPSGWETAALENLVFGDHQITVRVTAAGVTVEQPAGAPPLMVEWQLPDGRSGVERVASDF